jgi:hypothetical protein
MHMARSVLAAAVAIAAVAVIALIMGIVAALPRAPAERSCGHLFDPSNRNLDPASPCAGLLRDRRFAVGGAAVVAGAASVVGVVAYHRVVSDG